jgi:hypothetical protein
VILTHWLCLITGCQTTPPTTPHDIHDQTPISPTANLEPIPRPNDLFPFAPSAGKFEFTRDHQPSRIIPYQLTETSDHHWSLSLQGIRVTYFERTPDGSIAITREDESSESVSVEYSPSLTILPSQPPSPQQPVTGTARVVVKNLTDQSIRDQGQCNYTIQYSGIQDISLPQGEFRAYGYKMFRNIELTLSKTAVNITSFYIPNVGWVAEQIDQNTKVFNLFQIKSHQNLRWAE